MTGHVPREMSHELFRRKFGLKPYYTVEHRGWKFIHLNNFLGDTWENGKPAFDPETGSLGEQQLNWFEAELAEHKPSFVFIHYPLSIVKPVEVKDYGVHALIKQHREDIQRVVSGPLAQMVRFRPLLRSAAPGDGRHPLRSQCVSHRSGRHQVGHA